MKKTVIAMMAAFLILGSTGCTDAGRAKMGGYGSTFKVDLYSGGKLVQTWTSTGKVLSEESTDGYYFNDKVTGKLVEVTGTLVITKL